MPNDKKPGPNDIVFFVGEEVLPGGTHILWKLVQETDTVRKDGAHIVAKNKHIIPLMIVDKTMQERCYKDVMKAASTLATAAIAYMLPSVDVANVAKVFETTKDGEIGKPFDLGTKAAKPEPSAN